MSSFAVMATLAVGFAGYGMLVEQHLREEVQYLANQQSGVQSKLQDLHETLTALQQKALQAGLAGDTLLLAYVANQSGMLHRLFQELRSEAETALRPHDRATLLDFLEQIENLYRDITAHSFTTLGELIDGGLPDQVQLDRMRLDSVQLQSAIASQLTRMRGDSAVRLHQFEEEIARLRTVGAATAMSVLAAMIVFLFMMHHYVTRPLKCLHAFVAKLDEPSVTEARAPFERGDEIGAIATALNRMLDNLHETSISRDHFNRVLGHLSSALIVIDERGRIDTVNAVACNVLDSDESHLLGRPACEVLPKDLSALLHGEGGQAEIEVSGTDGQITPMLIAATRLPEPEHGWVIAGTDIRVRKQAEDEIRLTLERQIELNELKTRFVSMTSHEFRTPLSAILSSAELIRDYGSRLPADECRELINGITSAVRRMSQMLDNVLLIGRADAGRLDFVPTPVEVATVCTTMAVESAVAIVGEGQARERLEVSICGDPGVALLDEGLLRHILGNLVSNAFKYSSAGCPVELTIAGDETDIAIAVVDHGIGIPQEHLPHIYEAFRRAKNVGTIAGTGLGLAIVKRSVELHNGQIEVRSELGKGSRFELRLPRR
jgi:signal transduction histidine kinase/HAMP domain-containing protein